MDRAVLILATLCMTVVTVLSAAVWRPESKANAQAATGSAALFDPVAAVLMGPRCTNCHQIEAPRQKDTRIRHIQHVLRGPDGHGVPALQCQACHRETNSADGKVPGVPDWHLAPVSMSWEGLSKTQICQVIKDPAKNGGRDTLEKVIDHMKTDPLVLWAWNPGVGRTAPDVSHAQFVSDLENWIAVGGPCP